jgi:hypothetical protein
MTDIAVIAASVKGTLREIGTQAKVLGAGLQNAAPGAKAVTPNFSVQYLLQTSENMFHLAEECGKLFSTSTHHHH